MIATCLSKDIAILMFFAPPVIMDCLVPEIHICILVTLGKHSERIYHLKPRGHIKQSLRRDSFDETASRLRTASHSA
jgi:hypothetical protein